MTRKVGIVGYGAHIPRYRIKVEEIAKTWGADAPSYKRGLDLWEKSVPPPDCDAITLAVEAAKRALKRAGIKGSQISSMYIGSESHPYAVKPSGTVVAEAIGAVPFCRCADYEFACKAGTEAMYTTMMLVKSEDIEFGMAIAADTSQGAPGDALEYSASAGAAAFVMGAEKIIAEIEYTTSSIRNMADAIPANRHTSSTRLAQLNRCCRSRERSRRTSSGRCSISQTVNSRCASGRCSVSRKSRWNADV
jgi:hydroxymethylglutaryl-CoA synthase